METHTNINALISSDEFMSKVANDVVRMADKSEGLESWLYRHSGSITSPSHATRRYAYDLFGDSMEASLFNACLVLEVDRLTKSALAA